MGKSLATAFAAVRGGIRARLESEKKARRRWGIVLTWALAVVTGCGCPATSFAIMTCEEALAAGGCVQRFYAIGYHTLAGSVTTFSQYPNENWDDTCSSFHLETASVTVPAGTDWTLSVAKYYWDFSSGTWRWVSGALNVMQVMTPAHLESWTSGATELGAEHERAARHMETFDLNALYPDGCPGSPNPDPDLAPNPDPGKPECPPVPLN